MKMKPSFVCLLACASLLGLKSFATTFTVTTTNDSGGGSLRDAITQANATAGADSIAFNLAGATRTINISNALPDIVESLAIDGSTQPGFAGVPLIELNGQNAGAGGVDGLKITTTNCVIRALVINRFTGDGIEIATNGNNIVEGCYIGLNLTGATDLGNSQNGIFITNSPNNVIGGIFATQRNFISGNNAAGIFISGLPATNNQILGNVVGLNVTNNAVANSGGGVRLNGSFNVIGGSGGGARNFISGNAGNGIELLGATNRSNQILGNHIGPDLTGFLDRGNSGDGVQANNSGGHQIGGSNPGEGNLISGNNSDGIEITGTSATNVTVRGNFIGTTADGATGVGNSGNGVLITSNSRSNLVGGIALGEANTIAFNALDGISVAAANSHTNNAFRANSIHSNGNLGIDLGATGIQANDDGDPDLGANQLQNFPQLSAATNHGATVTIAGNLKSRPSTQFALDFFANVLFNTSGSGEGQFYLGSTNVTTGADSNVNFTITLPVGLSGRYVSATATDPFGNTSEFSTNVVARSTVATNVFVVSNTNDTGVGSLREAINSANVSITATPDLIAFAIPGAGPHIIAPSNALPPVADAVIIDGYTQTGASPNSLAVGNNAVLQIRLDGNNTPNNVPGLSLWGGNSTVRGLSITRFKSASGHGIEVFSTNNLIAGNFIGIGPEGTNDLGNGSNGIFISGAANNLIGGTTPASRNVIAGNTGDAVEISGAAASGNTIQGNYIGTSATGVRGTVDLGNGSGINLNNAPSTLIGGNTTLAGNVIADNAGAGISTGSASATNNAIQGNLIGTDVNGAALGNNSHGVNLASSRNTIGGIGAGEANTIAYNNGDGVFISSGTNNVTRGNSIFENGGLTVGALGIDLGSSGVLLNDFPDAATGANLQQNYPYLTNATANAANTQILGELRSRSNTTYQIDFYSSVLSDPSNNGEGQKWLGSVTVNTDGTSNAVINATVPGVAFGRYLSATATDPFGNTSEFSTNVVAGSTIGPVTFTVVNTNDSGPGSLRAAISNANAFVSSGNDIIAFNILGAGPHVIAITSALPALTDPATIDGYTQPGAQTNTLADGNNAVLKIQLSGTNAPTNVDGLRLEADGCVVRGLAIVGFKGTGDGIEIISRNNTVEGNFIGLQTDGTNVSANANNGILVNSAANTIGGATTGARNVISGNSGDGVELFAVGASNNVVAGNFIGTDAGGLLDRGNGGDGVLVNNAPGNIIGGATAASRNVISGNQSEGITIQSSAATNNQVLNNYIGTEVTGTLALGNSSHGVFFTSGTPSGNQIGSPNPGGNIIAFNGQDGVFVSVGTNNAVRANNIFSNGGATAANLGIDIGNNGLLTNDFPDVAIGANWHQNFPELISATANPANTQIQGRLRSRPSTTYQLDFFSSLASDPSGNGEGQKWLGTTNVTTDASGSNFFNVAVPGVVLGRHITATATDPFGNTSEFGTNILAGSTIPPATFFVRNTNNSGPESLRQALLDNNNTVSGTNNLIRFEIPGVGPHTIAPLTPLPVPTERVTIDGYTQPGALQNTVTNGNNAVLKVQLDGVNAGFSADGLSLTAIGGNIVRGLSITRFDDAVELGTNGNNRIEGNFLGVDVDGITAAANRSYGVNANNSPGNVMGGTVPAARNVVSANNNSGVRLGGAGSSLNRIEGNFIGTDFSGTLDRGNLSNGILLDDASTNTVGGTTLNARNVISGNNNHGVSVSGTSQGNLVEGNYIGCDVTGAAALGNSHDGVSIGLSGGQGGNAVGGTNTGAGNLIAFNARHGVTVLSGTNNPIRANTIFANISLGIDLNFDFSANANDPGDPDTGANQLQNYPVLAAGTTITPANTTVQGSLNSRPNTTFELDFFANVFPDPVYPNGEGQQFIGSATVTTGADSNANFNVTLPVAAVGRHLTATATDPFGNTSEFSRTFAAVSTFPPVTFVVTNTLDSGPGSLRQALLNNNATASATNNVVSFNIPGAGPHVIAPSNLLSTITEPVTIDGFSQPGATTNTLANGNNANLKIVLVGTNAAFGVPGLSFSSPGNLVRGLNLIGFRDNGIVLNTSDNVIEGCVIGLRLDSTMQGNSGGGIYVTGPGNRIGGTSPGARNVISGNSGNGITITGASATNNVVQGNFIGTDLPGTLDRGNGFAGINSAAVGTVIGGSVAGAGNVISGNNDSGVNVALPSDNTTIKGNRIGISFTDEVLGNTGAGVQLSSGTSIVGGTTALERNVISGNNGPGVQTSIFGTNSTIVGNYIGTDSTGALDRGNFGGGISISVNGTRVGGVAAGEGNVIAFNSFAGVTVGSGTNNTIRGNRFFLNNGLGIDLNPSGVTPNDVGDADAGPNQNQNFPELTNAVANVGNTLVQGRLDSRPNTVFQLDFFANAAPDPSGYGEGQYWLGATSVTTDGAGVGTFSTLVGVLAPGSRHLTATATDPDGNTSEFSTWIMPGSTIPSVTLTVTNTLDSGPGSLRQALLDVDLLPSAGNDIIQFAIPGSGVRTIAPLTLLPTPRDSVTIDGYTQAGSSTNTLLHGNDAVILIRLDGTNLPIFSGNGLALTNHNNIIRGLEIIRAPLNAIDLGAGNSNLVTGNLIWSNVNAGVFASGGSGNRIGGQTPGARNVISANGGYSIELEANTNSVIQGNFLGTDFTGTSALGGGGGVLIEGGTNNLIGPPGGGVSGQAFGNPSTMRNVISGNDGVGVLLTMFFNPSANVPLGHRIFGNLIGTDVTGTFGVSNQFGGIILGGAVGTTIGGTNENEPNLIAFNVNDGIQVSASPASATNNHFQANSIFDNTGLGIDLSPSGVTPNDGGDADPGPNELQNFPSLTNANITTTNLIVQGTLNSLPSTTYRVDFYANLECDPTGNGEGKHWLGSVMVTTGADSNAAFNVNLPFPPEGQLITATATDPSGNTSEFCACLQYGSLLPPVTYIVTNTNDSGPGSLRKVLEDHNATFTSGPNRIEFNIAGAGVKTIAPLTPFPDITRPVIIDGFTQPGASPDTATNGNNAVWLIRIDCSNAGTNTEDGLHFVNTSSNVVRGLCLVNTPGDGIEIEGGIGSLIEENLIGIDVLTQAPGPGARDSGGPAAAGMMTYIGRDAIDFDDSGYNQAVKNVLGNARRGINVRGLSAINNSLRKNIIGVTLGGDPAPIALNGIRPNNAAGTEILGGKIFNTGGSAVATIPYTLFMTLDLWSFGNINSGLLLDRNTDGVAENSTTIPLPLILSALTSGGVTTIQGGFLGAPNHLFDLIFYAYTPANGYYRRFMETPVMTGPSGIGSFNFMATGLGPGDFLRATAANSAGTSGDTPDHVVMPVGTPPNSDLSITKTDSADPVMIGSNFTYTITVSNAGPANATNIVVRDFFPSGLFPIGPLTTTHGQFLAGNPFSIHIPVLTNGEVAIITLTTVNFFATNIFTNTVTVSSAMPDPNMLNNTNRETTTIIAPPPTSYVQFSQPGFTITEGQTSLFTVFRSGDTSNTGKVDVVFVNGAAFNGQDFTTPLVVPLTFPAGEITKPVPVPTTDDSTPEQNEAFLAVLQNPQGLVPNGPNYTTGFIVNNDGQPANNLQFFPIVVVNPLDGSVAMDWTGLPGQSHLLCTHSLNDPFHTMPGFAPPMVITPNGAGNPNIFGYDDLLSPDLNKNSVPQEFFRLTDTVPTGTISGTVRNPDGTPAVGQIIRIGDSHQVTATAINGTFSIQNVPAGEVPISFEQLVAVSNIVSTVEHIWVRIVAFVDLVANGQMAINVKVELPKIIPKPPCNCVPWCGIVGGTFNGVQKVVAGGGKRGDCTDAPVVVVTGPGGINEGLLGKRKTYSPAANGTWKVTSTICGQTKTCEITLP
jgi:uncharacterized repeat protein (TIGR01451 family)